MPDLNSTTREDVLTAVCDLSVPAEPVQSHAVSSFAGNVLKLVSGSTSAQIVTVLAAPFIARLFAPEAFGVAALFVAFTGVLSAIVGMRYEVSIVLPERDGDAANSAVLSSCFVILTSAISAVLIIVAGEWMLAILRARELQGLLWLAPINILLNGLFAVLTYWNIRKKQFGIQGVAQLAAVVFFVSAQIIAALWGHRSGETIIVATVLSGLMSATILGIHTWLDSGRLFRHVSMEGMLYVMKRYSSFPKYSTASAILNNLGWQMPTFFLSAFFSPSIVGYYSLGNRLLRLPVSLVSANIATVFYQYASESNREGILSHSVDKMFYYLTKLFVFPSLLLTFIGKDLFQIVFGGAWVEAGVYTQILSIYVLLWFMSVPLGITLNVLEKQSLELSLVIAVLLARIGALIIGGSMGDARIALVLFAVAGVATYGYYCFVVFRYCGISCSRVGRNLCKELRLFIPAGVLLIVLKWLHVDPAVVLLCSAVMTALYYLNWIQSDSYARDSLRQWRRKLSRGKVGSESPTPAA